MKVDELTEHAMRGHSQKKQVLEELENRSTRAARRLKETLVQSNAIGEPRKPNEAKTSSASRSSGQDRSGASRSKVLSTCKETFSEHESKPEKVNSDLSARFEILRATFTVEGELLARWGMTEDIPPEIEDRVFALWRKRLSNLPDDRGRSLRRLDEDLVSLSEERAQRQVFRERGAHGSR
jgi:hypothetical protein